MCGGGVGGLAEDSCQWVRKSQSRKKGDKEAIFIAGESAAKDYAEPKRWIRGILLDCNHVA